MTIAITFRRSLLRSILSILLGVFLTVFALIGVRLQAANGEQRIADLGACKLDSGQQITGCQLGYRTYGRLNAEGTNAVLIPSWFNGNSKQLGGNVGAGKLLDPAKYFVIAVDAFGDGISSSPSNSTTQPR